MPLIKASKGSHQESDRTAIGFHIEINDGLLKGFDTHACIRLKEMYLMAFHDLFVFGDQSLTPITTQYRTSDLEEHPAITRVFNTNLNKGSAVRPFFIYDRDNLVQMTDKDDIKAHFENLTDPKHDDYYNLINYETSEQMVEQNTQRKNECDAKVMSGELSTGVKIYQACLEESLRKDSFKDRMHQKFMRIYD